MKTSIWTKEETDILLNHISQKKPLKAFSDKYKRTDASIKSRLKIVAAEMYFKDNTPFDIIQKVTGIDKSEIIIRKVAATRLEEPIQVLKEPIPVLKEPLPVLKEPLPVLKEPMYTIRRESPFETVYGELLIPLIKTLSTIV